MKGLTILAGVVCIAIPIAVLFFLDKLAPQPEANVPAPAPIAATADQPAPAPKSYLTPYVTPEGMVIQTMKEGTGRAAEKGDLLSMHYTGWTDGFGGANEFDSSRKPGRTPFQFTLGANQVIGGWDRGCVGMMPGEVRHLTIPPELGYGASARPGIPANSTLYFIVELVSADAGQ